MNSGTPIIAKTVASSTVPAAMTIASTRAWVISSKARTVVRARGAHNVDALDHKLRSVPVSARRSAKAICSSVNRAFFIAFGLLG
jgi:hypothetical protein